MANLLYLTHRVPYPPNKGDKITTFHFLRHLASRHRVFLGTFVDDPDDLQHRATLESYCAELRCIRIEPRLRRLASARALLTGASISDVYYRSRELQAWVDEVVPRAGIDRVLAYCSAMAPYAAGERFAALRRVTHYADVDSEKWKTYADKHRGPMRWVYGHEARALLALERKMTGVYDVTSFVSDADAALYRGLAPESAAKVQVIPNGVDTDYFDPAPARDDPFPAGCRPVVFVGAMDYWPNVDAVVWFATEVLGRIRRDMPAAEFWIVGSNPARQVQELQALPGVRVTGRVPDVRPYVAHAASVVAPLRVARGTQNKVLEAYSMARQVVLTGASANGLIDAPFVREATHDDPAAMAAAVVERMQSPPRLDAARDYVRHHYSWEASFALLDAALEPDQVLRGR